MTKEKEIILKEFLKKFDYNREFETENFLYWIRENYKYNGKEVSREEFERAKKYTAKHGTLPFIPIKDRIDKIRAEKSEKEGKNPRHIFYESSFNDKHTGTSSVEIILRYSKQYDTIEFYRFDTEVRKPVRGNPSRVLIIKKRTKEFSINTNNRVLFSGKRWLSLKNWSGFTNRSCYVTEEFSKILLKTMLDGAEWVEDLKEPQSIFISNKNARRAKSLNQAIEFECGARPAKIIRRAMGNDTNSIIQLYSMIDPNQIHNLTNFIKRNHSKIHFIIKDGGYAIPDSILFLYFASKDIRVFQNKSIVMDYFRMAKNEGEKINLNISSYRTIKEKHDEISSAILQRNRDKRRLKVSKIYPKISPITDLEVEQIRSAERLNMESEILHHCVHSYKTRINNGSCSIYSLEFNGDRYTLQVNGDKIEKKEDDSKPDEYKLTAVQLKGKYNCSPPVAMRKYVEKICSENNIELTSLVVFEDKKRINKVENKEKVEMEQIGESVLDLIVKEISDKKSSYMNMPF